MAPKGDGSLGAITVDNLVVPEDATCDLEGTIVQGTVFVESAPGSLEGLAALKAEGLIQ